MMLNKWNKSMVLLIAGLMMVFMVDGTQASLREKEGNLRRFVAAQPKTLSMQQSYREGRAARRIKEEELIEKQEKQYAETKEKQPAGSSSSSRDYQVLLNIVQAEAGNSDPIGKILVANVVLNRVKSAAFPNTITDVVYEKSQFSPVSSGSINRVKVSECTKQCVTRALNGEDYSQGALYFMNRRSSQSGKAGWFDRKLTYLFQYQSHEFFK